MRELSAAVWSHIIALDHTLVSVGGAGARYAVMAVLLIIVAMALSRLLKLSFKLMFRIVLPAALVAWAAAVFGKIPAVVTFPVLVALGSAWVVFKPTS